MNEELQRLALKVSREISKLQKGAEIGSERELENATDCVDSIALALSFLHAATKARSESGRSIQLEIAGEHIFSALGYARLLSVAKW